MSNAPLAVTENQAYALVGNILRNNGVLVEKVGGHKLVSSLIRNFSENTSNYTVDPSKITPELVQQLNTVLDAIPGTSSSFTALRDVKTRLGLDSTVGFTKSELEKVAGPVGAKISGASEMKTMMAEAEKNFAEKVASFNPQSTLGKYAANLIGSKTDRSLADVAAETAPKAQCSIAQRRIEAGDNSRGDLGTMPSPQTPQNARRNVQSLCPGG